MKKLYPFILATLLLAGLLPFHARADDDVIIDLQGVIQSQGGDYSVVDANGGEYAPLTGAVYMEDGLWINALSTTVSLTPTLAALSGNGDWSVRLHWTPQYSATDTAWPAPAYLFDLRGASDNHRVALTYDATAAAYHVYINGLERFQSIARTWAADTPLDLWLTLNFDGDARLVEGGVTIAHYQISELSPPTFTAPYYAAMLGSDYTGAHHANLSLTEFAILDHAVTTADISAYTGRFIVSSLEIGNVRLLEDLYSYWDLDEAGGVRYDSIDGQNLTDNNTVLTVTGQIGTAAAFVAANDEYLSYYNQYLPNQWTWAGWARTTWLTTTGRIITARDFSLGWYTPTHSFYIDTGPDYYIPGANSGDWLHLAVWANRTEHTLGLRIHNNWQHYTIPDEFYNTPATEVLFGYALNGALDEWGMWERVLNAAELDALEDPLPLVNFERAALPTPTPTPTPTPVPNPSTVFLPFVARNYDPSIPSTGPGGLISVDYGGDETWYTWAQAMAAWFDPVFSAIIEARSGLETMHADACTATLDPFLGGGGDYTGAQTLADLGEAPAFPEIAYALGWTLGAPIAWFWGLVGFVRSLNVSYLTVLLYFIIAGLGWIAFVAVITYSANFVKFAISSVLAIYDRIPFKAT